VVGSDNFRGGQLVAEYFLSLGKRRFLFVGDTSYSEIQLRRQGLVETLDKSGSDLPVENIEISNFSYETAFEAANRYLDACAETPDAIFTYSDTAAMAFICALRNRGIQVPDDVSVVGYNDIPSAAYFSPPITTVRQDTYQAGKLLVDKLLQMLDGVAPQSEMINTRLLRRAT
jgi:DNA-binding LacI/PurR family transcriptional regulator